MEQQQRSWGGHRQGAGRKPQDNARNVRASFMLSQQAADALARLAEQKGVSRNAALNELLESIK